MHVVIVKGARVAGETRARMVEGAVRLLATQGTQGTSFADVLELTGAPRGSIYHHFPAGKDQLLADAVDLAGGRALAAVDAWAGRSPEEVTASFLGLWRAVLERSGLRAGCAVLAVTVSTGSAELLGHAATVFRAWRTRLADLFVQGGLTDDDAAGLAATLVAASEGAVVVSRAEQSMEPFELVATQLLGHVRCLTHVPTTVREDRRHDS